MGCVWSKGNTSVSRIFGEKMSSDNQHMHVRNFLALVVGQYGSMFCTIFFSLWLTRLLSPSDFGIVAISLFYFNFFNWATEWGWEQGLIAHKEIPLHTAASTHFFVRFCTGILPFIVFLFGYPFFKTKIAHGYYTIVLLLAVCYALEKISATYKALLERENKLKKLAMLEFLAIILSYMCAVCAALLGYGVVSLVVQRLVEKLFLLVGYGYASPWKFGADIKFSVIKTFFKTFGIATWIGMIFSLTLYDFMPFLLGNIEGVYAAGIYAKAFSMATFPLMLTAIFARMTTPLYTRYQYSILDLQRVFLKAQTFKFVLLFPAQLFLCCTASYWIPYAFGVAWISMVPVYRLMTVYGFCRAFFDDVPNLFTYGFKNPWVLTKNQIIQSLIIMVSGPLLVYCFGVCGGAITSVISMVVGTLIVWKTSWQKLGCSFDLCLKTIKNLLYQGKKIILRVSG